MELTLEYLIKHVEHCWKLHREYKETKDKIFFFIATLFMTVLVGTGVILYFVAEKPDLFKDYKGLNLWHYALLQSFFYLLFIYYNYNRLISETYLLEVNNCSEYIKVNFSNIELHPFSDIKNDYVYHKDFFWAGWRLKQFGNIFLGALYGIFSLLPLIYKFKILQADSWVITMNWGFFISIVIFFFLFISIHLIYNKNITYIESKIKIKWRNLKTKKTNQL